MFHSKWLFNVPQMILKPIFKWYMRLKTDHKLTEEWVESIFLVVFFTHIPPYHVNSPLTFFQDSSLPQSWGMRSTVITPINQIFHIAVLLLVSCWNGLMVSP
jgi:hypothetical protein